jgi:hypothetical protein
MTSASQSARARTRPIQASGDRRAVRRAGERRAAASLIADLNQLVESGLLDISLDGGGDLRYRLASEEETA